MYAMKIEKTYEKFSVRDFIMLWSAIFTIFVIIQFLIYFFLLDKSIRENMISFWIHPLMYPTIFALGSGYLNKNGIMTISDLDNPQKILSGIDQVMDKWGFTETRKDHERTVYDKKTKWGRFWNYIFKEGLEVIHEGDNIKLRGKRNTFLRLEYKLKKM
jgi:hypothetical protein